MRGSGSARDGAASTDALVSIERVTVGPGIIDVTLRAVHPDGALLRTSPAIAGRAIALLPGLAGHACLNDADLGLAAELADTEVPHLFEHLVLELMAEAGSPRSLRGSTAWDFAADGRGVYHVSLEYDDDLVCLGAIKCARAILGHLLQGEECPDAGEQVAWLRGLRGLPAGRRIR